MGLSYLFRIREVFIFHSDIGAGTLNAEFPVSLRIRRPYAKKDKHRA